MTPGNGGTVFVMGYGNPGRLDDGLGPAFSRRIQAMNLPGIAADANYQLGVEDAVALTKADQILFADASVDCAEPYDYQPLKAVHGGLGFSSHSLSAAALLGLAEELFGATPRAYMLAIRGYSFNEFGEHLSDAASRNLDAAVAFMEPLLRQRNLAL